MISTTTHRSGLSNNYSQSYAQEIDPELTIKIKYGSEIAGL